MRSYIYESTELPEQRSRNFLRPAPSSRWRDSLLHCRKIQVVSVAALRLVRGGSTSFLSSFPPVPRFLLMWPKFDVWLTYWNLGSFCYFHYVNIMCLNHWWWKSTGWAWMKVTRIFFSLFCFCLFWSWGFIFCWVLF